MLPQYYLDMEKTQNAKTNNDQLGQQKKPYGGRRDKGE
jgi:hypothetical protein